MAKDIILICAIGGFLIACAPDAGTECARRFAEIAEACPVGTAFVAAASSTSECGGGASILTGSSGEVTGYCARQGECVVQCQVQPNFCSCGVESFTKERISCSPCTGACPLPGQSVCNGQTIVECSNEGQWSARETCRDGNVCAGADGTARCSSPAPSGGEDGGVRSTDAGTFVSSRTLSSTIGLVFWLDADDAESIEFENGRIVAWRNKSPIVSDTLVPETTDSQPQYEAPGSHHGGAVRFRGYQSLLGTTTYQLGDSMAFVRFRTRMAIWSQSIFYIGWETQLGNRPEWAGCCMATELAGARIYHTNG